MVFSHRAAVTFSGRGPPKALGCESDPPGLGEGELF